MSILDENRMNRAVFLDRDGVINRIVMREGRPYPPRLLEEMQFFPKTQEAIDDLRRGGYRLIVVTNQPDVGKGIQKKETVEAMHALIHSRFKVDEIKVCYHTDADSCECRKPKPGMICEAAFRMNIDLGCSFMVGDRWRDIEAGKAAGCRTIWIRSQYEEKPVQNPDYTVETLYEASRIILSERK